MVDMSKKKVSKQVKVGENPNILYRQCGRSIKIPVFKQQRVPNTGKKDGGKWGNWGGDRRKFCPAHARHAKVLS